VGSSCRSCLRDLNNDINQCTHACTRLRARSSASMHANTHTHTHTCTHTHNTYLHIHTCPQTHTHTQPISTYTHTCTHIHTYTHRQMHTHICTHAHTHAPRTEVQVPKQTRVRGLLFGVGVSGRAGTRAHEGKWGGRGGVTANFHGALVVHHHTARVGLGQYLELDLLLRRQQVGYVNLLLRKPARGWTTATPDVTEVFTCSAIPMIQCGVETQGLGQLYIPSRAEFQARVVQFKLANPSSGTGRASHKKPQKGQWDMRTNAYTCTHARKTYIPTHPAQPHQKRACKRWLHLRISKLESLRLNEPVMWPTT